MKKLSPSLLLTLALVAAGQFRVAAAPIELISLTNSIWKYYQGDLTGTNWTEPAFADSTWAGGPGLLAFEQNTDIVPLINTTLDDPRIPVNGVLGHAYYFRTHFTWPNPTNFVTLRFSCRIDDCAAIYLNGVLLTNMGVTAPITFASLGRGALGAGTDAVVDENFSIFPGSLLTGDNVLAVEVHQVTTNSSDIVWGARLEGETDTTPPTVTQAFPGPGSTVRNLNSVDVFFSEAVTNVQAADLLIASVAATNVIQVDPSHYTFECVQPLPGTVLIAFSQTQHIGDLAGFAFAGTNWTCTLNTNPPPASQGLVHRYSFAADASDSIGSAHGQLGGGATISGGAVVLNGSSAYVNLPNNLVTGLTSVTIEAWLINNGSGNWARIFDFGNSTAGEDLAGNGTQYVFMTPGPGAGTLRYAVTSSGPGGEQQVNAPTPLQTATLKHVVLATDAATTLGRLYVDGVLVGSNTTMSLTPAAMGPTVNNWIGRSQFSADAFLNARITEFRIWEVALTREEIVANFESGPDVVAAGGPVAIRTQPQNQIVGELLPVTFSVAYNGARPARVQWFRNNQPIPGATNDIYSIASAALSDNNAVFRVALTNTVLSTTYFTISSNATLTVTPDNTAPTIVQAVSAFPDGVAVEFSEGLRADAATNIANYGITHSGGTLAIFGARLDPSLRLVILTTGPQTLGTLYTLTVNGVVDLADAGNMIAPNSQATFTAVDYAATNIGNVAVSPQLTPLSGGYDFTGAGTGIGGTNDQFAFGYRLFAGDFDLEVRIGSLPLSHAFARAGLMARASFATNGLFAASFATPGPAGCFFASRASTGTVATLSGSFPANYPDTWVRLRRAGNVFSGFASLDGQAWNLLGSATVPMPLTIAVGLALNSGNASNATTAQFRELANGSGVLATNMPLPFEPLGPCTRRTALVFSEFMYNPPSAWGGTNNLEFVELWNSGLVSEDLSGFRLAGDISYTFPTGTVIRPGQFLVVASDPTEAQSFYGVSFLGPYTNNLGNNHGTLRLLNELGGRILNIEYDNEDPWPAATDGTGHSLVLNRPSYGENDPRAWAPSDVIGGSPGRAEHRGPEPLRTVVINEFLANTDPPLLDYVELFNTSLQPVDISGAWLSDEPGTNKFRIADGTTLGPRSFIVFDQTQLGFSLSSDGEQIILVNSNRTRVIDAVAFEEQATDVASGRFPDGAPGIIELASRTPGSNNAPPLQRPIVINEIMYHPISGDNNDEYIELHNRGTTTVALANWQLDGGVQFRFPSNAVIAAGGYVVVAENLTNLLAKYPQLNATNTFGNYAGALRNSGERILLRMPETTYTTNGSVISTNTLFIVVGDVRFLDGGRWGKWSDGGGSSLELIDPRADNRYAANWADSDESAKAPWTTIDVTAVLENGQTSSMINQGGYNGPPNRFEFFPQDDGEAIADDIEFRNNGGPNLVNNGDFAGGTNGYSMGGVLRTSFVQNGVGSGGSPALHLVATDRGDAGANKIATPFTTGIVTNPPNTGTIRAKVRWLKGSPYIMFRTRGHWMEVSRRLDLPQNLGTPGLPNSRLIANAGPVITDVSHSPVLPAANQAVVVSARVSDVDPVTAVSLAYRLDPATTPTIVLMRDDGTGGDALPGDGIYSATIPGQSSGALVAFYIFASDSGAATTRFPDNAPARECHVRWGETAIGGSIGNYRLWLTASNIAFWTARERNANDPIDATFVYGNSRVIYNAKTLYSGSPFHSPIYSGPLGGNPPDFELNFNPDEKFLGHENFVLAAFDVPNGNFFYQDKNGQVDITGNWIARKLGQPFNYRRQVHVILNGARRGTIYDDAQQPNGEYLEEWFPGDQDGELRKIEDWFEFADDAQTQGITTATIQRVDKAAGGMDTKRYRWNWRPRVTENPDNWFALTNMIAALNDMSNPNYVNRVLDWVDLPNFLRPIVSHHIVGDWDSYGYERGKNMYAYKPDNGPWRLLLWDIELALNAGGRATNDGIFSILSEPVLPQVLNNPTIRREYLWGFLEAVNTSLLPGAADVLLDERYASFLQNGVPMNSPQSIKNYIAGRRANLLSQIPTATFAVNGTNFLSLSSSNLVVLTGTAPVNIQYIFVNGVAWPVTWTGPTTWSLRVAAGGGTNLLTIEGIDHYGNVVSNGTRQLTLVYDGPVPSPQDNVVFNEIMYQSVAPNGSFVELFNMSTNFTFDLSGWRINGLGYTFPNGSIITPRGFLVLVENRTAFLALSSTNVFDQFNGRLDPDGETLSLIKPGPTPEQDVLVDRVRYEPNAPWAALAAGGGASLQVIDPRQDNSRAGNWGSAVEWRYVTVTGSATSSRLFVYLTAIGDVFIDDMMLVDGTVAELGTNRLRNSDFEAALTNGWTIPSANQQVQISATNVHSGVGSLHFVSTNAATAVNAILIQDISPALTAGGTYTLSYWYRPAAQNGNVTIRISAGTLNSTHPIAPALFTPGANNFVAKSLPAFPPLWLNEVLPLNVNGILDNHNEREPWIELYNSGAEPVSLDGLFLTHNYSNATEWAFPAGTMINPGEFKVIVADGESGESTASELHTGFRLSPGTGSIALTRMLGDQPQVIDYLNYSGLAADRSYGDFPDGQPFFRQELLAPSPGAMNTNSPWAALRINEWLASNTGFIRDPADNDTDDWFEIYNPTTLPVDLGNWYLSDTLTNITQYRVPHGYTVPAGGYLLVWADGETGQNSTNRADLHANFNLRAAGEAITLAAPDGTLIDSVTFGQQTNNVSQGRSPDGSATIVFMTTPTPRGANTSTTPAPMADIVVAGNNVTITFSTTPGRSYRVEYKTTLDAVSWTELAPAQVAAGPSMSVPDSVNGQTQRFYRIVLVQ